MKKSTKKQDVEYENAMMQYEQSTGKKWGLEQQSRWAEMTPDEKKQHDQLTKALIELRKKEQK
jgi:hypothetical protein